ncbi:MAG TPA: hypothetical protein VG603_04745 [Chitinophagales bacterium]|nr:hypothetical protein [Chitinophagales bacterium]
MSLTTDCTNLPDHVIQACNNYRKGGVSAIAIIDAGTSIPDPTSDTDWTTAITAGHVKVIKNIKATFPKASVVEGENVVACGAEKMLDGFNGSITWKDFNVNATNDDFYAQLNLKTAYIAIFYCNENEIRIFDQLCNFAVPWATAPEGTKDKQVYDATAMWFAPVGWFPSLYTAPAGIFS